jgi:tetratricopeptide (TPR) repeat protein
MLTLAGCATASGGESYAPAETEPQSSPAASETPRRAQALSANELNQLGLDDLRAGDRPAAIEKFQAAVELDPKTPYMFNLARGLLAEGEDAPAKIYFERIVQNDDNPTLVKTAQRHLAEIEKRTAP